MYHSERGGRQLHQARIGRVGHHPNVAETREYPDGSDKGDRTHRVGGEVNANDVRVFILSGADISYDKERPGVDDAAPVECAYAYGSEPGE
jgi:hypothetical protein